MEETSTGNVLGVLGGMGPLASAEFLKTIYEAGGGAREQDSPVVVLYSDPTFPDRTEAFLRGEEGELLRRLVRALYHLRELGATKTVICCVTIHHLLPRLPADLRRHVVSLLDVIFDQLEERGGRHLLLCTTGTSRLGIFQKHRRWEGLCGDVVLPTEPDQKRLHELIYGVKRNHGLDDAVAFVEASLRRYGAESFIVGCTEVHLMAKRFVHAGGARGACLDPLMVIARQSREARFYE